jgi:hypothetical protein
MMAMTSLKMTVMRMAQIAAADSAATEIPILRHCSSCIQVCECSLVSVVFMSLYSRKLCVVVLTAQIAATNIVAMEIPISLCHLRRRRP